MPDRALADALQLTFDAHQLGWLHQHAISAFDDDAPTGWGKLIDALFVAAHPRDDQKPKLATGGIIRQSVLGRCGPHGHRWCQTCHPAGADTRSTSAQLADATAYADTLQQQLQALSADLEIARADNRRLTEERDTAWTARTHTQTTLKDYIDANDSLKDQINAARQEADVLRADCNHKLDQTRATAERAKAEARAALLARGHLAGPVRVLVDRVATAIGPAWPTRPAAGSVREAVDSVRDALSRDMESYLTEDYDEYHETGVYCGESAHCTEPFPGALPGTPYDMTPDTRVDLTTAGQVAAQKFGIANYRAPLTDFERRAGVIPITSPRFRLSRARRTR